MTKAIGIYVEWVMVNMNAQRIRAHIMPGNIGSSRVFEKNGFVPVNRSEDAFNKPGPEGEESSKDQSLVFEWIKNKN